MGKRALLPGEFGGTKLKNARRSILFYIILIAAVVLLVMAVSSFIPLPRMQYDDFVDQLNKGNVATATLKEDECVVTLKENVTVKRTSGKDIELKKGTKYGVDIPSQAAFMEYMNGFLTDENNEFRDKVDFTASYSHIPAWVEYIPMIAIIAVMVIFMLVIIGQNNGNSKIMTFAKSRARLYTESKVRFSDVAGAEEEKEELEEIVDFLKFPKKYFSLGARIPKGVLMVGPPGTGKTYLAKAVAGEANVPFFSISGSDFVEMYVGVGAARVRDMFEQAKKNAPCIIFIDEIDAVGRHRGAGLGGGHDEREQTLNQILVEMDGFEQNAGIVIIAATNRPDILDPALTRPGRFDRKIVVNYPDIAAREKILEIHARNKKVDETVSFKEAAKNTAGFTAADLENLMNEAALLAARRGSEKISTAHMKEAIFRVLVGPEKRSHVITENDKKITAYHEAGHAIIVKRFSTTTKVDRVSIIPAGSAGGYTSHRPDEDLSYYTSKQLFETIVVALGGRAAEELIFGDVSTGASSDLQNANSTAMKMVTKYGMSKALGNMIMDTGSEEIFLGRDYGHTRTASEELSSTVDREVRRIIDEAYEKAKAILNENNDKLELLAKTLLEKERIEKEEFDILMDGKPDEDDVKAESTADNTAETAAEAAPAEASPEAQEEAPVQTEAPAQAEAPAQETGDEAGNKTGEV